jgi:hypothetical protein
MTVDGTQYGFSSYLGTLLDQSTAGYTGFSLNWVCTSSGGAVLPELKGIRVAFPADYTNFGSCQPGYFSGDGRTVIICDDDHALDVTGDVSLNGELQLSGVPTTPGAGAVHLGLKNGTLGILTDTGYLEIGSINASYCHFQTDLPAFYFNTRMRVQGDLTPQTDGGHALGVDAVRWSGLGLNPRASADTDCNTEGCIYYDSGENVLKVKASSGNIDVTPLKYQIDLKGSSGTSLDANYGGTKLDQNELVMGHINIPHTGTIKIVVDLYLSAGDAALQHTKKYRLTTEFGSVAAWTASSADSVNLPAANTFYDQDIYTGVSVTKNQNLAVWFENDDAVTDIYIMGIYIEYTVLTG